MFMVVYVRIINIYIWIENGFINENILGFFILGFLIIIFILMFMNGLVKLIMFFFFRVIVRGVIVIFVIWKKLYLKLKIIINELIYRKYVKSYMILKSFVFV